MTIVKLRVPDDMIDVAVRRCADLARVDGIEVSGGDGIRVIREIDEICHCGRKMREERWVASGKSTCGCPLHGGGDAA